MADELKTVLGFEAKDAIATLATLSTSLNTYSTAMSKAASVTGAFNKSASGIEKNVAKLGPASKKATTETKKLGSATEKLSQSTNIVTVAMDKYGKTASQIPKHHPALQRSFKELGKSSTDASKKMVLSWESVIRIFAIQVIHQMISKITSSLGEAGREAIELENRFAEIQTIGGSLKDNFEGVSSSVRALSDEFGITSNIVAEGIYQTLSNQVAEAEQSFRFFAAAAQFSIGAVTSGEAAVNLLSSTINAFGYNASQATVISGKLFKTIELGRIRGEDFANTFGRVAVLASKLGVSLDEVLASIATLTISGLKYDEAFTLITNTMLKMIRPSEELKRVYDELGVSTPEAIIQAYGFQGALQKLVDTTDGSVKELGNLFTRVRALRGILGLTGDATKKFIKNLEAIKEAGAGDIFEAKELIFKTNAKEVELELNRLKNAITYDFGRPALAAINDIIQSMGGLVNIMQTVAASFGVMAVAALAVGVAFHPWIAVIAVVGVATAALVTKYRAFTKTTIDNIEERVRAEEKAIAKINTLEAGLAEDRIKFYNKQLAALQRYNIKTRAAMGASVIEMEEMEEYLKEDFKQNLRDKIKAFDKFVKSLEKKMKKGVDNIVSLQGEIFDLQRELSQEEFGGATEWGDDVTRASKILERGNLLRGKAQKAYRAGQKEQAKSYSDEAKSLAEQAKSIGESADNSVIIRQSNTLNKNVLKDGIRLREQEIKLTQQEIKATKQLKEDIFAGKPVDIKVVTDIQKIFDNIQAEADKPKNAIEIMIKDITGEKAGSKKAQMALVERGKEITEIGRRTSNLTGRQKEYQGALNRLPETFKAVQKEMVKTLYISEQMTSLGKRQIPGIADPKQLEASYQTIRQAVKAVYEQVLNLTDPAKYEAALQSLGHQKAAFEAIGKVDIAKGIQLLIDDLEKAKNAGENIKIDIEGKEALDVFNEKVKDAVKEEEKMGSTAKSAASVIGGAANNINQSLSSIVSFARQASAAIASVHGGLSGLQTAHWGKLMYRAAGGAIGTDTIHAMLSPGEFVVNADSTKKFFSQLVAINSGITPRFNPGGPVTNVGDININVHETTSAKQTARETMGAFRRELRRNTGRI